MELLAAPKFRGEKCNNPFNIDESKNKWLGKSDVETDKRLEEFDSPLYGIRAGIVLLKNYYYRYGLTTISKIYDRYAPPNENDTEAYKAFMAERLGVGVDEEFDFEEKIFDLAKATIHMEQGRVIYPDEMIQKAIDMALNQ